MHSPIEASCVIDWHGMSRRRDTPALYELIAGERRGSLGAHGPLPGRDPSPVSASPPPDISPAHSLGDVGGPQRSVRMPMGFVAVAVGVGVVLIVLAYAVGHSIGAKRTLEETQRRPTPDRDYASDPQSPLQDPGRESDSLSDQRPLRNESENPSPAGLGGESNRQSPAADPPKPGRNEDTRVAGLNYLIIEQFDRTEADKVSDFLIGQGIDVMVLPAKNPGLYQVIARRGIEGPAGDEREEFERRVVRLGKDWKSKHGGSKNFDQCYFALKK